MTAAYMRFLDWLIARFGVRLSAAFVMFGFALAQGSVRAQDAASAKMAESVNPGVASGRGDDREQARSVGV
jgi:hypothetical protein